MNEPNPDLPLSFEDPKGGSPEDYEQLRRLFVAALGGSLILAISINIFFIRQESFTRKDLETVRPQLGLLLANYQKVEDPQIKTFLGALVNYGRTHPDFNPILAKYKIAPASPSAAPITSTPTVAPATSKKK